MNSKMYVFDLSAPGGLNRCGQFLKELYRTVYCPKCHAAYDVLRTYTGDLGACQDCEDHDLVEAWERHHEDEKTNQ